MKINSSVGLFEGLDKRESTEYIVVHMTATYPKQKCDVHTVHQWHLQNGWLGIGYNFLVERSGVLRVGRPIDTVGAHVQGINHKSVAVCVVGGVEKDNLKEAVDNFTDEQYKTTQSVIMMLKEIYPEARVVVHKDVALNDTNCCDINFDRLDKRM